MIFILRFIAVMLFGVFICVFGVIFCLFNPRNPKNVARFSHVFTSFLSPLFGIKVITRVYPEIEQDKNRSCIYIANHQDNFDLVVAGHVVQPNTVTVGKKSLAWIPFFGQLYYLSGNILIDRDNKAKARDTISQVVNVIKEKQISIWMFPEGTRSRGRGLLPFKTGAFRAAIAAGVPIVPICISSTQHIKINRWNNGYMIVEMLAPIETTGMSKDNARQLMEHCYGLMSEKINALNSEVDVLNRKK